MNYVSEHSVARTAHYVKFSLFSFGAFAAVDLLEKMLVLDTDKRITAAEALAHAYFAQYHDPDDEPVADPYDQSFESRELEIVHIFQAFVEACYTSCRVF